MTGATKGIGLAISRILAGNGYDVVGVAREPLAPFPGRVELVDLDDATASAKAFGDLAKRYSFDGVVNNARRGSLQRVGEVEVERLDDLLRFNLHPAVNAVQAILQRCVKRDGGVSSTSRVSSL